MANEQKLLSQIVTPLVRRLSEGQDLSASEVELAFDQLFELDLEGFYWLAFTLALHTKGETANELLGLCNSIQKLFGSNIQLLDEVMDISGTGGRPFKTLNIGTTSAFVIAGSGKKVAKQGSTAVTGLTGSMDILSSFGVDLRYYEDSNKIADLLEKIGIVVYHSFLHSGRPNTRPQFITKIKQIGLTFVSTFHLVGSIPSPITLKYRVFGCYSHRYHALLADLFQLLNYERGMVVSGLDGLDEISTTGATQVLEFSRHNLKNYQLVPEELGLAMVDERQLYTRSREENITDFLRVLRGLERGAKRDIVLANAAAGLYIMGKVDILSEGVNLARYIIDDGAAWNKLEALVLNAGDGYALESWKTRAGID